MTRAGDLKIASGKSGKTQASLILKILELDHNRTTPKFEGGTSG